MAQAYAKLIMAGKKTMDDVPDKLKEAVQAILDEAGWEPPEEEPKKIVLDLDNEVLAGK